VGARRVATSLRDFVLRPDDRLLQRIRWLFALFNVLLALLSPLELGAPTAPGWPDSLVMVASFVGLGLWTLDYFRAEGRGLVRNLAPIALLVVGGLAAGDVDLIFARLYVALFLQSLYPRRRVRVPLLSIAYFGIYETLLIATEATPAVSGIIADALSVVVVVAIMGTMAAAVARQERLTVRDAILTEVIAKLLEERDHQRSAEIAAHGALRLVETPGAVVTIWRRDGARMRRVALAGRTEHPLEELVFATLPPDLQELFLTARVALLDTAQVDAIMDTYGLPREFASAVMAPFVIDDVPGGAVFIASPVRLDPDLAAVIQRFAHEVALAQQLADRTALLGAIVENCADVILTIDEDSRITYVSPRVVELSGRSPNELVDAPLGGLLADPDEDRALDLWTHPPHVPVTMHVRGTGEPRVAEVTASRLDLGGWVLNLRDLTEHRRLQAEITYRAFHDTVTGLANRARFMDRLHHALQRAGRGAVPAAVLMIDLDDFKAINDGLGHAAGDAALVEVADRLQSITRDVDTPARIGGDEFAVLLDGVRDLDEVVAITDRLLAALDAPLIVAGQPVRLSASVGIALSDVSPDDEVLRHADAAMYAAKAAGKNQYAVFTPEMLRV
jgi:diguanylate cyclase (GGDEF)-like protein/PAS domain S-box-containing protein